VADAFHRVLETICHFGVTSHVTRSAFGYCRVPSNKAFRLLSVNRQPPSECSSSRVVVLLSWTTETRVCEPSSERLMVTRCKCRGNSDAADGLKIGREY